MCRYESRKFVSRTTFGQRTCGIQVRHKHFFPGAENLVGFPHEMHPTHHDDVGIRLCRLLRQSQAVTHKICQILYDTFRVVVGHDYGILFAAKVSDFLFQIQATFHGFINEPFFQPFFFNHIYILFFFIF